ncbi:YveK family protein [Paenilisteria rocourtiae]|uniref:Capsular polysaccharide biosynthesis protein n=2 Tax=Listeria rocourtiae TaxID=647910 RepID=A0A4R6ZQ74_9LIST|nr:Wzz/FepE/Etk N-terminal domain-containing protein [Listeria rocourtiae]EUJ48378.1 putative capsular polysaccharide biosynthesis protein YwqC [Listeria rocourtiae FSL F6-920]TDR54751.1 capsular polysaccharide biosynthesis protein [Listeria rocourtiae]
MENMKRELSLVNIVTIIRKKILIALVIAIMATCLVGVASYQFMAPKYDASVQLLINPKLTDEETRNYRSSDSNTQLVNTYNVILQSKVILDDVIERLDLSTSVSGLRQVISVQNEKESKVISIHVEQEDPKMARAIAETLALSMEKEVPKLMNIDNVNILSDAELSGNLTMSQIRIYMILAFVMVLTLSLASLVIRESLKSTFKTIKDFEDVTKLPVIVTIPEI